MLSNKKIRIFAGPNGSGKSTLFVEFSKNYKTGVFINADEIEKKLSTTGLIDLKEFGLEVHQADLDFFKSQTSAQTLLQKAEQQNQLIDFVIKENFIVKISKETHSYEGAFIASFLRHLLLKNHKSFSFETVMSHGSKILEVEEFVKEGYKVYVYFLCIDSPEVNISRVNNRQDKGGHGVPDQKVKDRYYKSLEHIHLILPLCYRAYLFDNSQKELQLIAEMYKGTMELKTDTPPNWFIEYILPHYLS